MTKAKQIANDKIKYAPYVYTGTKKALIVEIEDSIAKGVVDFELLSVVKLSERKYAWYWRA